MYILKCAVNKRTHTTMRPKTMQQQPSQRWVWQTIPALRLPSVQAASSEDGHIGSKHRSLSLVARVESRVAELKEEEDGAVKAIKNAEEILRARRR